MKDTLNTLDWHPLPEHIVKFQPVKQISEYVHTIPQHSPHCSSYPTASNMATIGSLFDQFSMSLGVFESARPEGTEELKNMVEGLENRKGRLGKRTNSEEKKRNFSQLPFQNDAMLDYELNQGKTPYVMNPEVLGVWAMNLASNRYEQMCSNYLRLEYDSVSREDIIIKVEIKQPDHNRKLNSWMTNSNVETMSSLEEHSNLEEYEKKGRTFDETKYDAPVYKIPNTDMKENLYPDSSYNRVHVDSENQYFVLRNQNKIEVHLWIPLCGHYHVDIRMKTKRTPEMICFRYLLHVRQSTTLNEGGLNPTILERTKLHHDDRCQVVYPLQQFLQENTKVLFRILLNTQQYHHPAILLSGQQTTPKKIFFLQPASQVDSITNFQLYTGNVVLKFFKGSDKKDKKAHIIIFPIDDTHMEDPRKIATFKIVDIIKPIVQTETQSDLLPSKLMNPKPKRLNKKRVSRQKKKTQSVLSRISFDDCSIIQPKTRFLRSGVNSRFKIRLGFCEKLVLKHGKRRYEIPQTPTLFQPQGSEHRFTLFEGNVSLRFKKKNSNRVVLEAHLFDKKRVTLATFVLMPNSKNRKRFGPTVSLPTPDHRPLVGQTPKESTHKPLQSQQRRAWSTFPNLDSKCVVYSVDYDRLPKDLIRSKFPFLDPVVNGAIESTKQTKLKNYEPSLNEANFKDSVMRFTQQHRPSITHTINSTLFPSKKMSIEWKEAEKGNEVAKIMKNEMVEKLLRQKFEKNLNLIASEQDIFVQERKPTTSHKQNPIVKQRNHDAPLVLTGSDCDYESPHSLMRDFDHHQFQQQYKHQPGVRKRQIAIPGTPDVKTQRKLKQKSRQLLMKSREPTSGGQAKAVLSMVNRVRSVITHAQPHGSLSSNFMESDHRTDNVEPEEDDAPKTFIPGVEPMNPTKF